MARGISHSARAFGAVFASCAFVGLVAQAQDAPPTALVALEEGREVQRSHSASDRYVYAADISDDETYLLRIEQSNLDLIVTVQDPSGEPATYDSPLFRDGSETVVLGPAARGTYRIEVHSDEHTGARGGHTVSLRRLTPSADPREVTAWRWMSDAGVANARRNEDGWEIATLAYARAAELWSELGRRAQEADALFAAATVEYWQRFNWTQSAQLAAEAESLYEAQELAKLAANAVHLRAAALIEQAIETKSAGGAGPDAVFAEALALLERARDTHERLGNTYELGLVTNNFGYLFYNKGEFDRARTYYEQAAVLMRGIDEWRGELSPLSNTAAIDAEEGNLLAAAETFRRMLGLLPEGKLAQYRAATLDNLGATELLLGNLEEALRIFNDVLAAQRALSERQGEGRVLARIGQAYFGLGELELAAQYLDQALPIALESSDGRTRGGVRSVRGDIAYAQRDYETALEEHTNALELAASSADRAHLQRLIAKDLIALGRYDEAKELAAAVRAGALESGSESLLAHASLEEARAELLRGSAAGARALFLEAQQIFDRLGLHSANAETLYGLSLAAIAQGRLNDAIELGARALDALEALRVRVLEPTLRASFAATRREYYETQIDSLMGRYAGENDAASLHAAFETSERGRARVVADLLQEASIDVRSRLSPDLLARQTELYARLADRVQRRDAALRAGAASADAVQSVVAEIAAIENDLKLMEIEWRRRSPEFASLAGPATLTVAEVQSALGDDEMLLQYSMGTRASYAWVVTSEDIVGVELADGATIDAAARRVLDVMGPLDQTGAAVNTALDDLARLVLQPVEPHLRGQTLVLALDGMLQYIPFAALPTRGGPLLAAHSLVAVPSMSALAVAPRRDPPAKTLAVFADPVLEQSDPRFATTIVPATERLAEASMAMRAGVQSFGRLLSTAYEADAISALVPPGEALIAHGFAATRDAVLTTHLRDYRYIHFATHGIVDSRHPALSALMLSRYDARGAPQDGFLRLHDIFNLELGADVVVLSACETALGRDVRGEGLLGLTQGFMYAGARSLVASLWQVPDRATAELMTRFYSYMLTDGMRPVDALRQAQLSLAGERRFSHPYYWAGFALLGDWR